MTVTMEDSQSVVMKKRMPELERLQLRKGKKKKRWGRKEKTEFKCNKQSPIQVLCGCKAVVSFTSAVPPSLPNCTPTTCWHHAGCREYKVEDDQPSARKDTLKEVLHWGSTRPGTKCGN